MLTAETEPTPSSLRPDRRRGRLGVVLRRIAEEGPLTRLELGGVALVLAVLAAAVYGPHIRHGGFLMDDWSNLAKVRYHASCCGIGRTGSGHGYFSTVRNLLHDGPAGYHIGLPFLIPLTFAAFGSTIAPHLALAAGLAVLISVGLYALLRQFRTAPVHAVLIASLVLIFPWSDANRLWAMASYNQVSVVLWLCGLLLARYGVRSSGRRALLAHALALVCYLAGIAVYELIAGPVLVSVLFYLHRGDDGRVAWRGLAMRWAADVAVTVVGLLLVLEFALPRAIISWHQRLLFTRTIANETLTLLGYSTVPFARVPRLVVLGVLLLVLGSALVLRRRLPAEDPTTRGLTRWLVVAAAGLVVLVSGYAFAIPGGYGRPLSAGIENRVNLVAGGGYVLIVYAVAALLGLLLVRALRRPPRWAVALPVAVAVVVGAGYVGLGERSAANYDRSFAQQLRVLHAIRGGGTYPSGSIIFPFDYPSFTAVGVPVYSWIWDLPPASKVILNDASPAAFPVLPGTRFTCEATSVQPSNGYGLGRLQRGRYRRTFFVDVGTGRVQRIDNLPACRAAVETFHPGPLVTGRDCSLVRGGPATRLSWTCRDGAPPLMRP